MTEIPILGQVALGYRRQVDAFNPAKSFGVQLNPKKSNRITFGVEDKVIVLAED